VAIGLAASAMFNRPFFTGSWEWSETIPFVMFVMLPFGATAWLLIKSRPFLLAEPRTRAAS
ncbi:MAG TPA: hypothetical protein VM692_14915, partial [Gammaproteobacteria bacterium]|nr:hypothetical protein [Gammaproteobacteria bacterium]